MIAAKVANALALDWPRDALELIVAVDGGAESDPARPDRTAELARAAGADQVLELPRGGKVRAQDAAVRAASGDLLAFGDANAAWAPDALQRLAARFADPQVGYACGRVRFVADGGTNQEGAYWRYELWLRAQESALASVTAGNGAIYAVRPEAYVEVDPVMGHDLSFPSLMVKRGWRAVYEPGARGDREDGPDDRGRVAPQAADDEPRVADRPARRAARPARLPAALRADDRLAPAAALRRARAARGDRAERARGPRPRRSSGSPSPPTRRCSRRALAGGSSTAKPLLLARYYVLTTASLAAGLYDHLRHGTPAGWDAPEGTR